MPVEGRGLSSRPTQDVVRDLEIGQPSNSETRSETADGVTRESEGGGRLSLLRPVRQDQPRRHSGACLCPVPLQQELAPAKAGGAPGIDGQDFADIEAYGLERWLAGLALALRQETYRPEPIRRVFIPKANGKLRPLGISGVRDRVCMTSSVAGAGADLRSRSSAGDLRLPRRAKRPAGGRRGGGTALPGSPGSRRCRPRGLLRESSACRPAKVGSAPDRGSARAASDQDVAGMPGGRNRPTGPDQTHDRGPG